MKVFAPTEELTRQLATLPDSPGVYIFKDDSGKPVYIGKAVSLRSRVRSYFNDNSWYERPKLAVLMPKVLEIETIITNSEKEALLVEATLIRQHKPRYNVALKDDRRYPWLAIEYDVAFPRLIMVRDPARYRKDNPRARVFGPFVETGAMWETVRTLRKVFPMRQRKTPFFKDRPCMNFHIGLCLGPCQKLVEESVYMRMVKQVEMFLAGRQSEVVSQLRKDMEQASERLEFEKAAKVRDRLLLLERIIEKQQVFFQNQKVSQDVIAEAHTNKLMTVCLMRVREGKLISAENVSLPLVEKTNWDEAFHTFVDQYYTTCEDIAVPAELVLQHAVEDEAALVEVLSGKLGGAVKVTVPKRGGKTSMIEMAQKNASLALEKDLREQLEDETKFARLMTTLQEELNTAKTPRRIECFDISNIQGTDNVASLVVFENGQSKKSDYRTFKIRSVEGEANDFASMKEVVGRRYSRIVQEKKAMPDLIVIDGGKGQLSAACEALAELGIVEQDIVGLAKKQEEVYKPQQSSPILLPRRCEALHLLQRVRDEAHRFAVTFHRKLRAKRSISSNLDLLPGVGKARRKILLDHFGSYDNIKQATLEELSAVSGIPKTLAKSLFETLRQCQSSSPAATDVKTVSATEETLGTIEIEEIETPIEDDEEIEGITTAVNSEEDTFAT
ncbi:MAG TPA: excinuclease ABC subunit UvrC [Trichormus sp.]|jgi:excinuclease ABC subunit C